MKVFMVYDMKYGNTKIVAENLGDGLQEIKEIETTISDVETVDPDNMPDFDVILIGSMNHVSEPARSFRRFIDRLWKLDMTWKQVTVFDTYLGCGARNLFF